MHELQKHILFFNFVENYYVSKTISKNSLKMVKIFFFFKEDKTVVRSSHPPLDTVLINCTRIEVKASPFKIAEIIDVNTPISTRKKIIEQNNFVNNSLHIISQQLDHIEEKIKKNCFFY